MSNPLPILEYSSPLPPRDRTLWRTIGRIIVAAPLGSIGGFFLLLFLFGHIDDRWWLLLPGFLLGGFAAYATRRLSMPRIVAIPAAILAFSAAGLAILIAVADAYTGTDVISGRPLNGFLDKLVPLFWAGISLLSLFLGALLLLLSAPQARTK